MDDLRGVKLPMFDGEAGSWPIFFLKFKKAVKSLGLSHLISVDGSAEARKTDEKGFDKDDNRVQSMLLNQLSDGAVHLVEDCETAAEMLKRLQQQYESSSASSILHRFNKALDLKYSDKGKMSDHLGELNSIVNQIRQAGDITIDKLHVVLMLRSIPHDDDWKAVIANLKAMNEEDLTKEKVARVLVERATEIEAQEEKRKIAGLGKTDPNTFVVAQDIQVVCYRCGKPGHFKRNCKAQMGGGPGPKKKKETPGGDYSYHLGGPDQDGSWIQDSGAPLWYSWDRSLFYDFEHISDGETKCIGITGHTTAVKGVGKVKFRCTLSDGRESTVTWNKVYYTPGFRANIASTVDMNQKGITQKVDRGPF